MAGRPWAVAWEASTTPHTTAKAALQNCISRAETGPTFVLSNNKVIADQVTLDPVNLKPAL